MECSGRPGVTGVDIGTSEIRQIAHYERVLATLERKLRAAIIVERNDRSEDSLRSPRQFWCGLAERDADERQRRAWGRGRTL